MSMQKPTLQNVRIRSVRDALHVFYAVSTKRLALITRRLDAEERRAISSGNVYVWEERGANTEPTGLGMERWQENLASKVAHGMNTYTLWSRTDGMGWGPSRVRDEFLFYNQKDPNFREDLVNPVTPWAQMMRKREPVMHISGYLSIQPERLVKQTYSVHVTLPSDSPRGTVRKWHLTAYFSQQRLEELGTIDQIPGVGDTPVPEGLFRSARAGKMRRDHRNSGEKTTPPGDTPSLPESSDSHCEDEETVSGNTRLHDSSLLTHYPTLSFSGKAREESSQSSRHCGFPTQQTSLVPLEYLQNISVPRRNPADEQTLRRFSSQTISSSF
ncbi:hypothetical protein J132_03773 [Termitomyces sp. J132]|nr:hypothetical protein J132_03773 [Termitomyces sp. J132]